MYTNSEQTEKLGWAASRIKPEEIEKFLQDGRDFIDGELIERQIKENVNPTPERVRGIIAKSLRVESLSTEETAVLLNVEDPQLLAEMKEAALKLKKHVYDNRIVTFAPLYMGNFCVNNCAYCGFKTDNNQAKRRVLNMEEVRKEVQVLAGDIGHKRLIVVYGEHPFNDVDFIVESIRTVYDVKVKVKNGVSNIRRVNVNAPPFCVDDLRQLHEVGIGTYQVFQETYHKDTYSKVHPSNTIKGDYRWRLYCMHRALEAGIDDVGIGALFGLYDWKFEVMGLVSHALELENTCGIGPHTVSFPRLEPALGSPLKDYDNFLVNDEDFMKIILVVRLAVPYTGLILTARETAQIRHEAIQLGVTQTDASTKIGIGGYSEGKDKQQEDKQQFLLGDTRSLDEVIREFAEMGYITSFCTAGYRCGRTGKCIMDLLRDGTEGTFCKLNAVLTFKEWLDDFASEETKKIAQPVLVREIEEIKTKMPQIYPKFKDYYDRIGKGERDLYL